MKQSEFDKLEIGDFIVAKNRVAQVTAIGYTIVEIQYFSTGRKVWKSPRQLKIYDQKTEGRE